ncbi:interleukin-6 [Clarias gariepinus]|uniref:interleukin-6 n=1 Tax=Clarias gariepinus TaxID=13013 RepID=UPI00234DF55D|nr:interleukin-6 [Clarias gariepinus]
MPSLNYLGLFLLALLPVASFAPYSGDADLYETARGEAQNEAHAGEIKWHKIARKMHNDIWRVRDEQFVRDFGTSNMTEFASLRMPLFEMPLLTSEDGCVPYNLSPINCLQAIYNGLRKYQLSLPYVERQNLTADHMVAIKEGTAGLLHFIKDTVKVDDDTVHLPFLTELSDDSAWTRKIKTHSILYNFKDFMADTSRAITYLSNQMKSRMKMKHIAREEGWLLKHKQ